MGDVRHGGRVSISIIEAWVMGGFSGGGGGVDAVARADAAAALAAAAVADGKAVVADGKAITADGKAVTAQNAVAMKNRARTAMTVGTLYTNIDTWPYYLTIRGGYLVAAGAIQIDINGALKYYANLAAPGDVVTLEGWVLPGETFKFINASTTVYYAEAVK